MNAFDTPSNVATVDRSVVQIGAGYDVLPKAPAPVKDTGRVKIGAGYKLLPTT